MDELSTITGKASDEAKSSTKFFRAPLLWILFPQIAAYILCECGFSLSSGGGMIAAGIALAAGLLACLAVFIRKGKKYETLRKDLWTFCFPVAVFFLAGTWWSVRAPKSVDRSGKPETETVVVLEIETPFRSTGKSWSGLARVKSVCEGDGELCGARIFYQFRKTESDVMPHEGMNVCLRGIARDVLNDAWFDVGFRDFLRSRNASVLIGNGDCVDVLDSGIFTEVKRWFACQKSALIQKLVNPKSFREREQRILTAMLLGEQALLPQEQQEDFMLTGTMHIFAVSGLHVSFFAALLFGIFSRVRFPYWSVASVTILVTCFYVLLTGAAPSAVRAWVMVVFLLSARLIERNSNPLNALVLAATLALWHNPSLLSALGFQLSYGVVASIFLYGIPLSDYLASRVRLFAYIPFSDRTRFQRFVAGSVEKGVGLFAISLGTFIAGAAFLAGTFEIFTPLAILVNLILVPCVGVLLGIAIFSALFFCIPGTAWFAEWLWWADSLLMFAVEVFTGTAAELPADFAVRFTFPWLGTLGGGIVLLLFSSGAFFEPLRSRVRLRFALPPVFLCLYLLAFAR